MRKYKSAIIDRYISGEITDADIEAMVENWHSGHEGNSISLHEYLGFERDEYAKWVRNQSWLSEIKETHDKKRGKNA